MSLSAGIIGLPNTGKSTLFNALGSAEAEADNYPFCTKDPNIGVVSVPDDRLQVIQKHINPEESIPAHLEVHDIAGLVEGASRGEGLGNQFLSHIREVDALIHVVRCFEDEDVAHVEGTVDPVRDVQIVQTELILADLQTIDSRIDKAQKQAKRGNREEENRVNLLNQVRSVLEDGHPARSLNLNKEEHRLLQDSHLLTMKPVLYVANINEESLNEEKENKHVKHLRSFVEERDGEMIQICAELEKEFAQLPEADQNALLSEFGLEHAVLERLIRQTYKTLGLISFFTIANQKLRAWSLQSGSTVQEAAGKVHSDFAEHFIRAEVFSMQDLVDCGDRQSIREAGRMNIEGKDYRVEDGDILQIRHDA